MKTKRLLVLSAFAALPLAAQAGPAGFLDVYYVPYAQIEFGDGPNEVDVDGDGYGLHALINVTPNILLTGEYQQNTYDEGVAGEPELETYRVGGGIQSPPDPRGRLALYGEYVHADVDGAGDAADGFGVHVRAEYGFTEQLNVFGQIGYLRLDSDDDGSEDGPEFLVGGAFAFTPQFGAFVDYRMSRLEPDEGESDTKFSDVRVGLRVYLGS